MRIAGGEEAEEGSFIVVDEDRDGNKIKGSRERKGG